jgi:translation initiation factor 4G
MSEEAAKKKGSSWCKELYEVKEKAAAAESLATFKSDGAPMGVLLAAAIREAFEVRGIAPAERLNLLKELLVEQLTAADGVLTSSMLEDAFARFMGDLHTWVEDNPKAPGVAGSAVGELAVQGHLSLGPCLRPILEAKGSGEADDDEEGGDQDLPPLVDCDAAAEIVKHVLESVSEVVHNGHGMFSPFSPFAPCP